MQPRMGKRMNEYGEKRREEEGYWVVEFADGGCRMNKSWVILSSETG